MRCITNSRETTLSTLYNEWQVLRSQMPKGFEKYFPGGKRTQAKHEAKPEEAPKTEAKGLYHLPLTYSTFLMYTVYLHSFSLMKFILLCCIVSKLNFRCFKEHKIITVILLQVHQVHNQRSHLKKLLQNPVGLHQEVQTRSLNFRST